MLFSEDLLYRLGKLSPFDFVLERFGVSYRTARIYTPIQVAWAFLVGVIYLKGQLAVLDLLHTQT